MFLEIVIVVLSVGLSLMTLSRGARLLQNKDVLLTVKNKQMIYSQLSPMDKRLFGMAHVVAGAVFLLAFVLFYAEVLSEGLSNIAWLLLAAVVIGSPPLMRRRSRPATPPADPPDMPTLEG